MLVDMQVEVNDSGDMFIGCDGEWYYVHDQTISDFLDWIIHDVAED